MPRNPEKNALVREERRRQILDAALSVYIHAGYHGTDMDAVAEQAQLAKGLVYYYYKTKRELFQELYAWMLREGHSFSEALLQNAKGQEPLEQLMHYVLGMFDANRASPRMMRFFIRMPFDAAAIFGPEGWREGAAKSDIHREALAAILERGMEQGVIPAADPRRTANSFWSVFVANLFEYSKLMSGGQTPEPDRMEAFREAAAFCFRGLGVQYDLWSECLERVASQKSGGGPVYEGL